MKILITGSRGFLGQALGRVAAERGHHLVGLSRSAQPAANWPGLHQCVDVVDDDLTDIVAAHMPGAIIHAAGPASVGDSFAAPVAGLRATLLSWANVLDAVRRAGVPATSVLLSSAAVYGQPAVLPVAETAPAQPMSPYGYAKAMAEMLGTQYASCFGLDVTACRLFSVIGPEQRRLLPWEVYRQLTDAETDEVVLRGSSTSSRDYLHVHDAATAIIALCELSENGQHAELPNVINIASGTGSMIGEVATGLRDAIGSAKRIRFLEQPTAGDPERWQGDVTTLGALLPTWHPRSLSAALADCVAQWSAS